MGHTGASSGARAAYCSGFVHRLSSPSRMSDAQLNTLRPATIRRIARIRSAPLLGSHVDRAGDRRRKSVDVVRIDDERLAQLLGGAGQRAQHQHAVLVVARRDEFLRDEIHPVGKRADDAEMRHPVSATRSARPSARLW